MNISPINPPYKYPGDEVLRRDVTKLVAEFKTHVRDDPNLAMCKAMRRWLHSRDQVTDDSRPNVYEASMWIAFLELELHKEFADPKHFLEAYRNARSQLEEEKMEFMPHDECLPGKKTQDINSNAEDSLMFHLLFQHNKPIPRLRRI